MASQKRLGDDIFPLSPVTFPDLPIGSVSWVFFGTGLGQNQIVGQPALVVPAGCSAPTITSNAIVGTTGTTGAGYSTQIALQADNSQPWTMIFVGKGPGAGTTNFLMGCQQRYFLLNQALAGNSNQPTIFGGVGNLFPTTLTVPDTRVPRMYAMSGGGNGQLATLFDVASGASVTATENLANNTDPVDIFAGVNGGRPVSGLHPSANFEAIIQGQALNLTALQTLYGSIKGFLNTVLKVGVA